MVIALIFITYIYTKPTPLGFFIFLFYFSFFLGIIYPCCLVHFRFRKRKGEGLRTASYYRWFFFKKKKEKRKKENARS